MLVFAWDAAGNKGTSEIVYFTIAEEPEQDLSPIAVTAAVSGASITAVGAGLLLYFKKVKKKE